jgi:hypothetical protein
LGFSLVTHVLLLPVELVDGLLELVDALAECVVGGGVLGLEVVVGLLQRVVDGFAETAGRVHLSVGALLVVAAEVLPLLRVGAPADKEEGGFIVDSMLSIRRSEDS